MKSKATSLVLLSGGVDSALLLWRASEPAAIFINYGQPSALQESAAARAISEARGCELVFAVASLDLGGMSAPEGEDGPRVVHGRNMVLLSMAANHAAARGIGEVLIGAHYDDHADYPDCRPGFLMRASAALVAGCGVKVRYPLHDARKANIMHEARALGVPLGLCWSCYTPTMEGDPCGTCNSCKARGYSPTSARLGAASSSPTYSQLDLGK